MTAADLRIDRVHGPAIAPHLNAVAALRIAVFREYPYLYDGDHGYEERYLATYAATAASLVVLARDGERVVGAATGMPLLAHGEDVVAPFVAAGYVPERVFYFGESVLEPAYRGRGIGHAFLDEREAHARAHGFALATFCAVVRAADDPRRPADYRPLDALWARHGFARQPPLTTSFAWREVGAPAETSHLMAFWTKALT